MRWIITASQYPPRVTNVPTTVAAHLPPTPLSPLSPLPPPCPPRSEQPSQFSHCVCVSGWLHPAPCFFWSSLPVFPFSCLLQARGQALPATGFWRQHRWVW
jgi:hypothetical protein